MVKSLNFDGALLEQNYIDFFRSFYFETNAIVRQTDFNIYVKEPTEKIDKSLFAG